MCTIFIGEFEISWNDDCSTVFIKRNYEDGQFDSGEFAEENLAAAIREFYRANH